MLAVLHGTVCLQAPRKESNPEVALRVLIQRVKNASVTIDGVLKSSIEKGLLVFVGFCEEDTENLIEPMAQKFSGLRIFEDENGKTNLSIDQVSGQVMVVSQFTLYADCKKGNRPSFTNAGAPDMANELYEYVKQRCIELFGGVQCGVFGADMQVSLVNDGPFTIILDSKEIL